MKKIVYYFGMLFLVFVFSGQTALAQTAKTPSKKDSRKLERMRIQKEKDRTRVSSKLYYQSLLKGEHFVFQSDYFIGPNGYSHIVDPSLNFLSVNGSNAIVQLGLDGMVGSNGVGGVTARGSVLDYNFDQGKNLNSMVVDADMNLIGTGFPKYVHLDVSDDGTGRMTLQLGNGRSLTMYGQVVSQKKASIFVGQSIF